MPRLRAILVLCILHCACSLWAAGAASPVRLVSAGDRAFALRSGEYVVSYQPTEPGDGWIQIRRGSIEGRSIGTKLADGLDLDVTDRGIVQGISYADSPDSVRVTIRSSRRWASFLSVLTAYKAHPGLIRWRVDAQVLADKVFDQTRWGLREPDCHFLVDGKPANHKVVRYLVPTGPATGVLYFHDLDLKSNILYLEDYSSMNKLYESTGCANPFAVDREMQPSAVSIGYPREEFQWSEKDGKPAPPQPWTPVVEEFPKFGYERPMNYRLSKGMRLTIGDTYLRLTPGEQEPPVGFCRAFVNSLAEVYQFIYKPPIAKTDWAGDVAPKLIASLLNDRANWAEIGGHGYIKSYLHSKYPKGELLTLTDLLLPLTQYTKQHPDRKEAVELRRRLEEDLPTYWDSRWSGFCNDLSVPVDNYYPGWYLLFPAVGVCDLALGGNPDARRMISGYRDRLLEIGRACDYDFADVNTSTCKQRGPYQFDVTGEYVYIMMGLYELSGGKDRECLDSAKRAAERIAERGFDYMYELNGTATGAVGCYKLYRATRDSRYLEIAYVPLANTLRWALLWECDYGVGKQIQSFWGFCATPGTNCLAENESHHARRFLRDFRLLASNDLSPSVRRMLADSDRYGPGQSRYALPPFLVKAGAKWSLVNEGSSQTTTGEIRYDSYVPLEDLHVGWCTDDDWFMPNPRNGLAGQEIYGAGGPIQYAVSEERD